MYDLHYNHIKKKYGNLLFTGSDSLTCQIKEEEVFLMIETNSSSVITHKTRHILIRKHHIFLTTTTTTSGRHAIRRLLSQSFCFLVLCGHKEALGGIFLRKTGCSYHVGRVQHFSHFSHSITFFNELAWVPFYTEPYVKRCALACKRLDETLPSYLNDFLKTNSDVHSRSTRFSDPNFQLSSV